MYKYDHDCPFEAYITNLPAYNNGILIGRWVKFPITEDDFSRELNKIGITDNQYEWFVSDYSFYYDGIKDLLNEYSSFKEMNDITKEILEVGT